MLDDALRLLESRREAFDAMVREKVAVALADPRPPLPFDEAMDEVRRMIEARRART
ncbi:MAG: antitoxin [Sphingomonadales bacterium]|nr:antitoxin [Sphingomonadales bacterium]